MGVGMKMEISAIVVNLFSNLDIPGYVYMEELVMKNALINLLINNMARAVGGYAMFGVIGKRTRQGNAMKDVSEYVIEEDKKTIFLKYNLFLVTFYFQ